QLQSTADMWAAPIGVKTTKSADSAKTRMPVGGQINYTTERSLRLADLPQADASADPSHPFFGHTFCFTGELQGFSRLEAMAAVAACGATNRQGITKKTTYVVIGRSDSKHSASAKDLGASGKERKARDYIALGQQITVLGEQEFVRLLAVAGASEEALPSLAPEEASVRSGGHPKPAAGTSERSASARTSPMGGRGGDGIRHMHNGLDKGSEGPQWLIKLKRVFGLK
uniref:BRCT domain-containing protein n=1 Tax=uncultured Arthrobacter sp. TaxID=114050 RepID=UPI0032175A21